jgi:flagellar biosynthesis/type III secretory pathway protein FliH
MVNNDKFASAQFTPLFSTEDTRRAQSPLQGDVTLVGGESADQTGDNDFFLSGIDGLKRKAYESGFADGEKKTLGHISAQLQDQITRWQQTIMELSARVELDVESFLALVEERTVSMAVNIAEKILENEIKTNPESIRDRLREAMDIHRTEPIIRVRVNPKDIVFLKQLVPPGVPADAGSGLELVPQTLTDASLSEDPTVEVGGFIVETPVATFDHTIRGQLLKIANDLTRQYESSPD